MANVSSNRLLDLLPLDVRDRLRSKLQPVALPKRTVLYEANETPRYAHFLTSGIASIVIETPEGDVAEVNVFGREALVEALHLLGTTFVPTRCFIQMDATALRMPFDEVQKIFLESEDSRKLILQFVQNQASITSQIAACNRLHNAEERLARWLLMVQDRVEGDNLQLTQEFLADMLGARRSTVALAAGSLQQSGLIRYSRGLVRITDRENLEHAACDCYPVMKALLKNLYKEKRMPELTEQAS